MCWSTKSDPGDSYKLADYLRTDGHRLRPLRPLDAATRQLQALVRVRDDHVAAKTAASNQLGALLEAHWPGAKRVFSRLGSQIALAFLDAYPTPESAARLGEARLAAFCRRHSYRGGRSPAELLQRLRAAPTAPVGLAPEVLTELVGAQVRLLRTLLATIADLDRALGAGLLGHAKARLLAPLPRIGVVNLAQVVAEVGPILDRAGDVEHASAECGATPVTRASGKTKAVAFRWAANTKARQALTTFASNSRHSSPWAAKLYADARRRGKHHPHAVRILARAWLRVIWACWHHNTVYDPAKHGAEKRLAA
jgi:transposase